MNFNDRRMAIKTNFKVEELAIQTAVLADNER